MVVFCFGVGVGVDIEVFLNGNYVMVNVNGG